ncbi:mechanosensitive ion channel family protein [Mastigocoleus sp. MO_188.B34]|uniref:mechanosensitive ion channel family protein n=1 Tax=Mastigocoleus sp. MO_188.B34 TaxID=3036635 RepID=UPI00260783C7|nr:mechanosensitive ion channel family protein [Mastigocoleus sp. MO_188.B34]MDJ0692917.1 mechanosensitive ion channel family protein [Mastigocoleus sp. MO_188.B34]
MKRLNKITRKKNFFKFQGLKFFFAVIALCISLSIVPFSSSYAQAPAKPAPTVTTSPTSNPEAMGVILGGEKIFDIRAGVGAFTAEERARAVTNRLTTIAEDPTIKVNTFAIDEKSQTTNLTVGNRVLLTVTDADARAVDQTRQALAKSYLAKIQTQVVQYRQERSPEFIRQGIINTAIATVVFLATLVLFAFLFPKLYTQVNTLGSTRIPALRIQNFDLLPATRISSLLISILKFLRWILTLGALAVYVPLVLSFFPWTKQFGRQVFRYFLKAGITSWEEFLKYLPNIFALGIVIFATFYLIKLVGHFFTAIEHGNLTIQGFYREWARPTYKLSVFLMIILAAVVAFPYLPGFGSPAFQGVSLFLGVLFSLGSTAVVANIVAGIILIYTRAFQIGDRVKISDAVGDVAEKTLLVTRIRTIKNVVITLPNSTVLTSQIVNYSAAQFDPEHPPLVLHTNITLGYDVPWRKVHEVLIDAAKATQDILTEPEPFVLQKSLDDFYVSYELNAYTKHPGIMARIYSELHQNIQDKCNESGIEILSPHYSAIRDGNQITIPENYLPTDYNPQGIRISPLNGIFNYLNNQSQSSFTQETNEGKD